MKRQAILTKSVGTKVSEAELALLEARQEYRAHPFHVGEEVVACRAR